MKEGTGSLVNRDPSKSEFAVDPGPMVERTSSVSRKIKNLGKRGIRSLFEIGQSFGVDVLPRHFYSGIPDIRSLKRDETWKQARSMVGVDGADVEAQFAFLQACCEPGRVAHLQSFAMYDEACKANGEPGFGAIDADFLFCFAQAQRPARIVQVGCGVSTAILRSAAERLTDYRPEIVCVEPYPTMYLKEAHQDEAIILVEEKAESARIEVFTNLKAGDFLFIDSTHAVRPDSEVNRLILEILPRLAPGVWVHFHDIYFPYDYQRGLLDDELFFSNESVLLHAFLIHNARYRVRASLSMMHHADAARLGRSLPSYRPASNDEGLRTTPGDFPGSIYLQSC
jgi:hypothetical protein